MQTETGKMHERRFDQRLLTRLTALSRRNHYNPYGRFDWPEEIDRSQLWCDENLLTTYGTDLHEKLDEKHLIALSHWECINFFSLNVHGIKGALEFVVRCMYKAKYSDLSEYLHVFMAEENAHMWFFAKFCLDYAGKIYPTMPMPQGVAREPLESDLYMFASTLIFEEYVDFYNRKVGSNTKVPSIVREVNYQHHVDESRHISFGREVVKCLYEEIVARDETGQAVARIRRTIERIFGYFIGLMYCPQVYDDAGLVGASGLAGAAAVRNRLRNDPARRSFHEQWFKRTAIFFVRQGILADTSCLN
jgi:hypothetical protein